MPQIECERCQIMVEVRKETPITKMVSEPGQPPRYIVVGLRYHAECPICGLKIQNKINDPS